MADNTFEYGPDHRDYPYEPFDWDKGTVLFRNGAYGIPSSAPDRWQHPFKRPGLNGQMDIIQYNKKGEGNGCGFIGGHHPAALPLVDDDRKADRVVTLDFECQHCSVAEPEWCMKASFCQHRDGPQCSPLASQDTAS